MTLCIQYASRQCDKANAKQVQKSDLSETNGESQGVGIKAWGKEPDHGSGKSNTNCHEDKQDSTCHSDQRLYHLLSFGLRTVD